MRDRLAALVAACGLALGACQAPGPEADSVRAVDVTVSDRAARADIAPAQAAAAPRPKFARLHENVVGCTYAAEVAPGLWRGGQPDEEGIAWLKSLGIATVLNLRHYHGNTEGRRVGAAGMRYERIPLESTDAPTPQQVQRFLDLATDPSLRPMFVHCLHGVDRTGAMLAVYRMEVEGWSNADALAEMEWFGASRLLHDLRRFVAEYHPTGRYRAESAGASPEGR
jgi:protein tyrosine phosphatase (PTP) superfamily phosphohydrolase (DUF442 family)